MEPEVTASRESLSETIPDLILETSAIEGEKNGEISLLDRLNVSDYLILKKPEDEGPDIRGGHPDALVIHATKAHKNGKSCRIYLIEFKSEFHMTCYYSLKKIISKLSLQNQIYKFQISFKTNFAKIASKKKLI